MPFGKGLGKIIKKSKKPKKSKRLKNDSVTNPRADNHLSILGKGQSFFNQSVTTVHKYCDVLNLNNSAGFLYNQVYRINSVFDPDYSNSGTNHQPLGRDQMILFYNRYRVDKFHYKITYCPTTGNTRGIIGVTALNSATNASTTPVELMEQPYANYRITEYTASSRTGILMQGTIYPHVVTGVTREKYRTDDVYQSLATANPSEEINFAIQVGDLVNSLAVNHLISVELHYTTTWFDPIQISPS